MQVFRPGEALGDEAGPDHAPGCVSHKTSPRLARENEVGDAGDGQRIGEAKDKREKHHHDDRGTNDAEHGGPLD